MIDSSMMMMDSSMMMMKVIMIMVMIINYNHYMYNNTLRSRIFPPCASIATTISSIVSITIAYYHYVPPITLVSKCWEWWESKFSWDCSCHKILTHILHLYIWMFHINWLHNSLSAYNPVVLKCLVFRS